MYEIVFFDVDGTILSEVDRSIPESTKLAITRLCEKGIKVVVATGRPHSLCEELIALGIDTLISANGALIKEKNNVIYKSGISVKTIRELSSFAELNGHCLSYFTDLISMNGIGVEENRVRSALLETLGLRHYPQKLDALSEEIYCMCLYADESEAQKFIDNFPQLRFVRFHSYVINILEKQVVSKSEAIKKVLDYYNIAVSNSIAFGDGGNDLDMLEFVGLGIAMGNGEERLKQKADFVTKRASEDGIYHALTKFGVI
ncbi:Putative bifunctional phosphatase/peptidyl-prolyl cis-trans isomerase [Paenibacillus allorhizoplanae]|uniref:Bifunctional phosphatase/peptidyl-prolyl cis-trans isomerase n=1 Tax=Paenibacillus allorhizoplanae TaxID=2905648 RepID=A0ABN8FTN3_9BACL|nr:Cof-type HAD-IIB family hydrolase [Paenibacillus allorhizoplanae]CAH1192234.1 Putative bifunctional phosphatase/peptidyl-prolyl cis-trans isomerase [Paenibacillus allorhizoplanae]